MEIKTFRLPEVETEELTVPRGTIGVVNEIVAHGMSTSQVYYVFFPHNPVPPASTYPGRTRALARKLHILQHGESCVVRVVLLLGTCIYRVTNEDGVARIERAGIHRRVRGAGTRYWGPDDKKPKPR